MHLFDMGRTKRPRFHLACHTSHHTSHRAGRQYPGPNFTAFRRITPTSVSVPRTHAVPVEPSSADNVRLCPVPPSRPPPSRAARVRPGPDRPVVLRRLQAADQGQVVQPFAQRVFPGGRPHRRVPADALQPDDGVLDAVLRGALLDQSGRRRDMVRRGSFQSGPGGERTGHDCESRVPGDTVTGLPPPSCGSRPRTADSVAI